MSGLLLEEDLTIAQPEVRPRLAMDDRWLVFRYRPITLFSLKMSRATATAGKTLLTPTPYAVKMAFLDAALRHGLTHNPDELVRGLAKAGVRIGVPEHACVTGTIQSVRQETRAIERKRNPHLPWYRPNIGMREFLFYQGDLRLAFDLESCQPNLITLLRQTAPAVNYLGRRGSFFQYLDSSEEADLDPTFTQPGSGIRDDSPASGHRATLDDFGPGASFEALNSFSGAEIRWGVHRRFADTFVPLRLYNAGPGFMHYCRPDATGSASYL
jgi:hypothetical protein